MLQLHEVPLQREVGRTLPQDHRGQEAQRVLGLALPQSPAQRRERKGTVHIQLLYTIPWSLPLFPEPKQQKVK